MTPRLLNIHQRRRLARFSPPILTTIMPGVAHYDHYVGVCRERVDERRELRIANVHALELGLRLATAELELLHDVGYLLEPVGVELRRRGWRRRAVIIGRPGGGRLVIVVHDVRRIGRYGRIPPGTRGRRHPIVEVRIIDRGGGHAVGGG